MPTSPPASDGGRLRQTLHHLVRDVGGRSAVLQRLVRVPVDATVWAVEVEVVGIEGAAWAALRLDDVAGDVSDLVTCGAFGALDEGALAARLRAAVGCGAEPCHLLGCLVDLPGEASHVVWLMRPAHEPAFDGTSALAADRHLRALRLALRGAPRRSVSRGVPGTYVVTSGGVVMLGTLEPDPAFERELVAVGAAFLAGDQGERGQLGDLHLRLTSLYGSHGPAVLVRALQTRGVGTSPVLGLSATRRRIVSFAVQGATVVEIARALDRSPETVRTHLKRIYAHVGVGSRIELAAASRSPWV